MAPGVVLTLTPGTTLQMRAAGVRIPSAFDLLDASPVDRGRIPVLLVAGHDATLAADAAAHVEVKPVLLSRAGRASRHARLDRRPERAHFRREDISGVGGVGAREEQKGH